MSPEERVAQLRAESEYGRFDPSRSERRDGGGQNTDVGGVFKSFDGCLWELPPAVVLPVLVIMAVIALGKLAAWIFWRLDQRIIKQRMGRRSPHRSDAPRDARSPFE